MKTCEHCLKPFNNKYSLEKHQLVNEACLKIQEKAINIVKISQLEKRVIELKNELEKYKNNTSSKINNETIKTYPQKSIIDDNYPSFLDYMTLDNVKDVFVNDIEEQTLEDIELFTIFIINSFFIRLW